MQLRLRGSVARSVGHMRAAVPRGREHAGHVRLAVELAVVESPWNFRQCALQFFQSLLDVSGGFGLGVEADEGLGADAGAVVVAGDLPGAAGAGKAGPGPVSG